MSNYTPLRKMSDALRQYAMHYNTTPIIRIWDNAAQMEKQIADRGWTIAELAKRAKRSSQRSK